VGDAGRVDLRAEAGRLPISLIGWARLLSTSAFALSDVRSWRHSGKHMLSSSSSGFDPNQKSETFSAIPLNIVENDARLLRAIRLWQVIGKTQTPTKLRYSVAASVASSLVWN
jgi:hypothetical protein